jgi:hypothetical protein
VPIQYTDVVWAALFDADEERKAFTSQPNNRGAFAKYLNETVGVEIISSKNSALSIDCYQMGKWLENNPNGGDGKLAIVVISYKTTDLDKLVAGFMDAYPSALREYRRGKVQSTVFPGVFLEFQKPYLRDVTGELRALLFLPAGTFTFTFTELTNLSQPQATVWEALMNQDGKTSQLSDYFATVKGSLLDAARQMNSAKKLDDYSLTLVGWQQSEVLSSEIYGQPVAVFCSRPVLDNYLNTYRRSVGPAEKEKRENLKKEADSATKF